MKKIVLFLLVFCSLTSLYSQQFYSLDGIEDEQGNTILFYRYGQNQYEFNPVYRLNTSNLEESLFIQAFDSTFVGVEHFKLVYDFEFFPDDVNNFMNVGLEYKSQNLSYIARNDSIVFSSSEFFERIDISKQDPQKVFVFAGFPGAFIRSWDRGYTFPLDSIQTFTNFIPIASADFDENVLFGFNHDILFCKNGSVVDASYVGVNQYFKMLYDINHSHIYRVYYTGYDWSLKVSSNKGDANTWTATYYSDFPIFITIDSTQSGVVYLADGRRIYKSTNYGSTFLLYKSMPHNLAGIYKKPNSDILYAVSKGKIFKITPDSVVVIKSFPTSQDVLELYPLSIGNYWVYSVTEQLYPYKVLDIFTREVLSVETKGNGRSYYKIEEKYYNLPYTGYVYERVDTALHKVYRFDNECINPDSEKVIDDFTAEIGDSLLLHRFSSCWDSSETFFEMAGLTNIFGDDREIRDFYFSPYYYSLLKGIGIYNIKDRYDLGHADYDLKGCVINGIVYGDTTFTDVYDSKNPIPTEYKLEQNYPNPFNPSTKISWQSPIGSWQTLKVYDVLGNEVATLVNEYRSAGSYAIEFNPSSINHHPSSGIYFYRLQAGDYVETKKMILLK